MKNLFSIVLVCFAATAGWQMQSASSAGIERIKGAKIFIQPLVYIGDVEPTQQESEDLWSAAEKAKREGFHTGYRHFEEFIAGNPSSTWVPSLRANLALAYRDTGRYTRALDHWETAWNSTRHFTNGPGKTVADHVLVNWTRLLSSLGRIETLESIFDEIGARRTADLRTQELLNESRQSLELMKTAPEVSYRCGTYGLSHAYAALIKPQLVHAPLLDIPSPATGFSVSRLSALCNEYKIPFVAVKRTSGMDLVIPSVVHWRQNHYAALVAKRGPYVEIIDPTFGRRTWLHEDVINEEASGYFFVPVEQKPANWVAVSGREADSVFGKGAGSSHVPPQPPCPEEGSDQCCDDDPGAGGGPPGKGGSPGCKGCPPGVMKGGMPTWEVGDPSIDLWIRDVPMSYQPSVGPEFALRMFYHQDDNHFANTTFGFGPKWNANILTYIQSADGSNNPEMSHYDATLFGSGGGRRFYHHGDVSPHYRSFTTLERVTNGSGGFVAFRERFPNGSENYYGFAIDLGYVPLWTKRVFLTERRDPQGVVTTQFRYSTNGAMVLLNEILDADGRTNIVRYHPFLPGYISEIENPYGHIVQFNYHELDPYAESGVLTNIVDVMNLSSSFEYALPNNVPTMTNMITPYGNTSFHYLVNNGFQSGMQGWPTNTDGINRALKVTEPNGGTHLYMYRNRSDQLWRDESYIPFVPNRYPTNEVPAGLPVNEANGLGHHNMEFRNSFYWGPRQYVAIFNTWNNLSIDEYKRARLRNWLHGRDVSPGDINKTLNMERNFGVVDTETDNLVEGEKIWYGYHGRGWNMEGTNSKPSWIAIQLPNGETRYTYKEYNYLGMPTLEASSYTVGSGYTGRTNTLHYAANHVDLIAITNQLGELEWSASYNTNHQVLFETNAVGDVTSYTHDSAGRLTSRTTPAGLTTTNEYTNGRLSKTIDLEIARTNSYTWSNGQIRTHTDERGLTITNAWDALRRLTNVAYPDGTFVAYTYSNLDIVKIVDRMGLVTQFGYDAGRRKVWELDARTNMTLYGYCACGSLEAITNAVGAETRFLYDNQGKPTREDHPDRYVFYFYNSIGQLRAKLDQTTAITYHDIRYHYNNQGLIAAVSNNFGRLSSTLYDFEDRATNSVDANGVSTDMTYDALGRILTRTPAGGGTETFTYSSRGLSNYVNQLSKTNIFAYDAARRKTSEINANGETNRFTYSPAGDLLTLTDGKSQVTTWKYDLYGRVTNKLDHLTSTMFNYKYDANGRLTNRWTPAKGHTFYAYDAGGNLTGVNYSNSVDLAFIYDPVNRLTNMLDGVGTTRYAYDGVGQITSDDGPWESDTVTYAYSYRLRTSLSLQQPNSSAWEQGYGYDIARRLTSVTSPAGTFSYFYPESGATLGVASPLHLRLGLPNGAYITNAYDSLARLTNTSLRNSSDAVLNAHAYLYNDGNQRTRQTRTGGDYVDYGYDDIGQLKTSSGKEVGGTTNRWQEQLSYSYDAAGNLLHRTNHTLIQSFGVNTLNQLTNQSRSGRISAAGTTTSAATNVTLNTTNAIRYADHTFVSTNHTLVNGNNTFTAIAQDSSNRVDTNIVVAYLPETSVFVYDSNGNMVFDGQKAFEYDDENQLSRITVTNAWKSEFAYDGKMRRRIRKEFSWRNGVWALTNEVRYIYDGNLVIQERDANNLAQITYTRGKDLSGSLEGVGGIGGLLARTDHSTLNLQASAAHAYYHADGNGNITMLISTQQVAVAKYLYDPFGNILSAGGLLADANLYRFSSKEWHANSEYTYFLYRFFSSSLQRWLTRDPVQESGGFNLFRFAFNSPIHKIDPWGLKSLKPPPPPSVGTLDPCDVLAAAIVAAAAVAIANPGSLQAQMELDKAVQEYNDAGCADDEPPPPKFCPPQNDPKPNKPPWWKSIPPFWKWPFLIFDPCATNPYFPGCGGGGPSLIA